MLGWQPRSRDQTVGFTHKTHRLPLSHLPATDPGLTRILPPSLGFTGGLWPLHPLIASGPHPPQGRGVGIWGTTTQACKTRAPALCANFLDPIYQAQEKEGSSSYPLKSGDAVQSVNPWGRCSPHFLLACSCRATQARLAAEPKPCFLPAAHSLP